MKTNNLFFIDCEAYGMFPGVGELTEFGAVHYDTRKTFHGILAESKPDPENPAVPVLTGDRFDAVKVFTEFEKWLLSFGNDRCVFVSDNPAYDYQWINYGFGQTIGRNPFGHSARRISDFYAGLKRDWRNTQGWKKYRVTPHDHNPVNDAMGNVEAFEKILSDSHKTE